MEFNILIIPLLTGPIFILAGLLLYKFPPKKINHWYGYRTARSMQSQERWDFAQNYSGKEMIKLGVVLMASSLLGYLIDISKNTSAIAGLFIMLVGVGGLFTRVEKAIKQKFSNNSKE